MPLSFRYPRNKLRVNVSVSNKHELMKEENEQKNSFFVRHFKEDFFKVTGFLVYGLAFLYTTTYLSRFDAAMLGFHSWDDYLLVFLPIINILLPLFVMILFSVGVIYFLTLGNESNQIPKFVDRYIRPELFYKVVKKGPFFSGERWDSIYHLIMNTFVISGLIMLWSNYELEKLSELDPGRLVLLPIFLTSFTFFAYFALSLFIKAFRDVSKIEVSNVLALIILLGSAAYVGLLARYLSKEYPRHSPGVSFFYEGNHISTDSVTVMIVGTRSFIILRDTLSGQNFYYERDRVTGLTTLPKKPKLKKGTK